MLPLKFKSDNNLLKIVKLVVGTGIFLAIILSALVIGAFFLFGAAATAAIALVGAVFIAVVLIAEGLYGIMRNRSEVARSKVIQLETFDQKLETTSHLKSTGSDTLSATSTLSDPAVSQPTTLTTAKISVDKIAPPPGDNPQTGQTAKDSATTQMTSKSTLSNPAASKSTTPTTTTTPGAEIAPPPGDTTAGQTYQDSTKSQRKSQLQTPPGETTERKYLPQDLEEASKKVKDVKMQMGTAATTANANANADDSDKKPTI